MKKLLKLHLICNLSSKKSALIGKSGGQGNQNNEMKRWKVIVYLQNLHFEYKNDKAICQLGKHLSFCIDDLFLEVKYYTPYRYAINLTAKLMYPLSYYLIIEEIFQILKL